MGRRESFSAADGTRIEGVVHRGDRPGRVIVCHPFTRFGGDSNNPVVGTVYRAAVAAGLSVVRFDFRGAGGSGGRCEEGRGEVLDLAAAVSAMEAGDGPVLLAGYSFGAHVIERYVETGAGAGRLLYIAPPVGFFGMSTSTFVSADVIVGDRDEYCPHGALPPVGRLQLIEGAGHFFDGFLDALAGAVARVLESEFPE